MKLRLKSQFSAWCVIWTGIASDTIVENIMVLNGFGLFIDIVLILTFAFISTCVWRALTSSLTLLKARILGR
ncbi:hypothetical protein F4X10_01565 [Candidatus Poribacteria bacterium]|nr:hypothetical protein [Candidatus Poribacteria bacterium]